MSWPEWTSPDGRIRLINADCLHVLRAMPDNSLDCIATDPPYYKVKGEAWDRQWKDAATFIGWIGENCEQWQRTLRANGSLYCFASPQMASRVEQKIAEYFNVLENITWVKPDPSCPLNSGAGRSGQACKEALRTWFPRTEEIIFAEHYGADNIAKGEAGYAAKCDELRGFVFEPLRAYLDGERKRAGVNKAEVNEACGFSPTPGGMASRHYFSPSQWCLPTAEHYAAMQRLFNAKHSIELTRNREYLTRSYEDLRKEYEDLRRPFRVTADVPYTDVWTFPTVGAYPGKHPCEKPLAMMEHIVEASTREDAVVFDGFAGSFTTAVACIRTGRRTICVEKDEHYWQRGIRRVQDELAKTALLHQEQVA